MIQIVYKGVTYGLTEHLIQLGGVRYPLYEHLIQQGNTRYSVISSSSSSALVVTPSTIDGDGSSTLAWSVSGDSSSVTGWAVGINGSTPVIDPASSRGHVFNGLTNGVSYTLSVAPVIASVVGTAVTAIAHPAAVITSTLNPLEGFSIEGTHLAYEDTADQLTKEMNLCAAAGALWVRIDVAAVQIDTQTTAPAAGVTPTRNWANIDRIVAAAQAAGLSIVGTLTTLPVWAAPGGYTQGPSIASQRTAFCSFAAAAALRYAGSINVWGIWNEPNNPAFWASPSVANYSLLLKQVYPLIKAANSSATILAGGTAGGQSSPNDSVSWYTGLYSNGCKAYFDAADMHPYPDSFAAGPTSGEQSHIAQIISIMNTNLDTTKKIWATEIGFPTGGSNSVSESDQSTFVISLFNNWDSVAGTRAGPSLLYTLRDQPSKAPDREAYFGCVRDDFSVKPLYTAYQNRNLGTANLPLPDVTCSAVAGDGQVTLNWVSSGDTSALTGWRVNDGGADISISPTVRTYTFTGLTNGLPYTLSVAPVAALLVGNYVTTTATPVSAPPTFPLVSASIQNGDSQATLSWTAVGDISHVTGWQVSSGGVPKTLSADARSYVFTGLTNGSSYPLSVTPVAGTVLGTTVSATAYPVAAISVSVSVVNGDAKATLNWSAAGTGVSTITGWKVSRTGLTPVTASAATRSYVFSGLTNGSSYTLSVIPLINGVAGQANTIVANPVASATGRFPGDPGTGKMLYGATGVISTQESKYQTAQNLVDSSITISPVPLWRMYYHSTDVASLQSDAIAMIQRGTLPWVSIKSPSSWAQVLLGNDDDWIVSLNTALTAVSTHGPVWFTYHHEPNDDANNQPDPLTAKHQFRDAWQYIRTRIDATNVTHIPILFAPLPASGGNLYHDWQDFVGAPGSANTFDILGFDSYPGKTKDGSLPYQPFCNLMADAAAQYSKPFAIGEQGVNPSVYDTGHTHSDGPADTNYVSELYDANLAAGAAGVCYYDTNLNSVEDWRLVPSDGRLADFVADLSVSTTYRIPTS